jgi:hypothetical protein
MNIQIYSERHDVIRSQVRVHGITPEHELEMKKLNIKSNKLSFLLHQVTFLSLFNPFYHFPNLFASIHFPHLNFELGDFVVPFEAH